MCAAFDQENIFGFLKSIITDLQNCVAEMKQDFQKNPPSSNIKERFLDWKGKYSDIINNNLKEYIFLGQEKDPNFDFREFLQKINDEYQNENEFLELLKTINTEIENLKDFIRSHLSKDSSIYYVKEI